MRKITELARQKGMDLQELAHRSGLLKSTLINYITRGTVCPALIPDEARAKIAMALDMDEYEIFGEIKHWFGVEDVQARYGGIGTQKAYGIIRTIKLFCEGGSLPGARVLPSELAAWEMRFMNKDGKEPTVWSK